MFAARALMLIASLVFAGCGNNLFYCPDHVVYDSPARVGLRFEQVTLASADGTRQASA